MSEATTLLSRSNHREKSLRKAEEKKRFEYYLRFEKKTSSFLKLTGTITTTCCKALSGPNQTDNLHVCPITDNLTTGMAVVYYN